MGPALMIFNDRVFSDEDLESIQKIGMGSKAQNSFQTGRFGLGFNACYNVTDYPSFLTRDGIYFFDPHCNVVEEATVYAPGQFWNLTPDVWKNYEDLFLPFEVFGLNGGRPTSRGQLFVCRYERLNRLPEAKSPTNRFLGQILNNWSNNLCR